jgi:hypothetical protein
MTWLYRDTTRRGNSIDRAQDWGFLWANIVLDIGKQGNWGSLIGRVPFVVRCLVGILGLFICFIRWSFFCYWSLLRLSFPSLVFLLLALHTSCPLSVFCFFSFSFLLVFHIHLFPNIFRLWVWRIAYANPLFFALSFCVCSFWLSHRIPFCECGRLLGDPILYD